LICSKKPTVMSPTLSLGLLALASMAPLVMVSARSAVSVKVAISMRMSKGGRPGASRVITTSRSASCRSRAMPPSMSVSFTVPDVIVMLLSSRSQSPPMHGVLKGRRADQPGQGRRPTAPS
jgi:hypothetical protein